MGCRGRLLWSAVFILMVREGGDLRSEVFLFDQISHNYNNYPPTTPPRCPRSNINKNIIVNSYYYLKDLSGSFIRRSPSVLSSISNDSILCCGSPGDNAQPPNNNHKKRPQLPQHPAVNICNNTSPERNYAHSEFLTIIGSTTALSQQGIPLPSTPPAFPRPPPARPRVPQRNYYQQKQHQINFL